MPRQDAGFWKRFVQTSSRAQAHPTITVSFSVDLYVDRPYVIEALLSHEIVGPRELMDALGKAMRRHAAFLSSKAWQAGAFSVGSIPTSCRQSLDPVPMSCELRGCSSVADLAVCQRDGPRGPDSARILISRGYPGDLRMVVRILGL